jgi:titin
LTVTFAGAADKGSAITGDTATCVSDDGGPTETGASTGTGAGPITVAGEATGDTYTCTVQAVNARGASVASAPSLAVVVGSPAAPTGVTATQVASGQVDVAFNRGSDNGSTVTGYTAWCASGDGGVTGATSGAGSPLLVTGLSVGDTYTCTVTATNARGTSLTSRASGSVTA